MGLVPLGLGLSRRSEPWVVPKVLESRKNLLQIPLRKRQAFWFEVVQVAVGMTLPPPKLVTIDRGLAAFSHLVLHTQPPLLLSFYFHPLPCVSFLRASSKSDSFLP